MQYLGLNSSFYTTAKLEGTRGEKKKNLNLEGKSCVETAIIQ